MCYSRSTGKSVGYHYAKRASLPFLTPLCLNESRLSISSDPPCHRDAHLKAEIIVSRLERYLLNFDTPIAALLCPPQGQQVSAHFRLSIPLTRLPAVQFQKFIKLPMYPLQVHKITNVPSAIFKAHSYLVLYELSQLPFY